MDGTPEFCGRREGEASRDGISDAENGLDRGGWGKNRKRELPRMS